MKTFGLKLSMIAHMMTMQDTMNTIVIGRDWVDEGNHPEVDFTSAMAAEAGEFPDHMGFKWWKKQEPDVHQAKLELVDIYHFMISHIAQVSFNKLKRANERDGSPRFSNQELKQTALDKTSALVATGASEMLESSQCGALIEKFNDIKCLHDRRKKLCRTVRRAVEILECDNLQRKISKEEPRTIEECIVEAVDVFFVACAIIGMSGKELYMNYVGKNVLNRFRQDNDYKGGTYVKIWNGLEDNQVLEQFINTQAKLDNLDTSTVDFEAAVYKFLASKYPRQNKSVEKTA